MRIALAGLIALAAGCGAGSSPLPPAPTVLVSLDGRPASGLSLRLFQPDGTLVGGGMTDAGGLAVLRRSDDQPVPPGTYKVAVVDAGGEEGDPMAAHVKQPTSRVPVRFGKPHTTRLSLTVEAGKMDHTLDINTKG